VSRALQTLLKGIDLHDAWEAHPTRPAYTHYTPDGASRIDRVYISNDLRRRKQGAETTAAAFSDRLAVTIRMTFDTPRIMRRNSTWKMHTTLLDEPSFSAYIKEQWKKWQRNIRFYPTRASWWERCVKRMIRQEFQREGAARSRDRRELENFYYDIIYQALRDPSHQENTAQILRKRKARILRIHSAQQRGVLLYMKDTDRLPGEEISIHHYVRSRKRRMARTITRVTDEQGALRSDPEDILRIFTEHMTRILDHIPIAEESIRKTVSRGLEKLPALANTALEEPITLEEL
jgi:hypothetical protein